jgi:hypothetical protein
LLIIKKFRKFVSLLSVVEVVDDVDELLDVPERTNILKTKNELSEH